MNFDNVKAFMEHLTNWIIPGNSIVIYKNGEKVFEYSTGFSNVEKQIKTTGDEYLYLYSCSKVATVTAALQLVEKGLLSLDAPLYEYIPQYRNMTVKDDNNNILKAKNDITIRHLFTMTAGFTYDSSMPCFDEARRVTNGKMDTLQVIKLLAQEPLHFEPGTKWSYSLCHDILAAVVETVTEKKFRDYVAKNIFEPLDMEAYYHQTPEIEAKMAEQYIYDVDETDIVKMQQNIPTRQGKLRNYGKTNSCIFGSEYDCGGAGIITKVGEYAKLAAALSNKGTGLTGNRILEENTVNLLKTNQLDKNLLKYYNWPQLKGYGYGLGVRTLINKEESYAKSNIGEFGWGGAAGATVVCDTDYNLAVFYAHHMLNQQEEYYMPRLIKSVYSSIR